MDSTTLNMDFELHLPTDEYGEVEDLDVLLDEMASLLQSWVDDGRLLGWSFENVH